MEEKRICFECGCVIPEYEDIWVASEQEYICEDCYNNDYCTCDECGDVVRLDDSHYINDTVYCEDCLNDNFFTCNHCGRLTHNDDARDTNDGDVCSNCYYDYYEECNECGDVLLRDDMYYYEEDDRYYCEDCKPYRAINSYSYKPEPVFSGNSNLYLGVELEIDGGGYNHDNAQKILDIEPLVYCKYDGSLSDGFEIVSHPCDLEYHMNNMKWQEILQKCIDMRYTSHNANTCGLHIHISKNALGNTTIQQDKTIANILYFTEYFYDKMLKFSRRTPEQLERWAKRYGIEPNEKPLDILDKAKKCGNRYQAVNLLPYHTIEFRLFRGTLKYTTFIATLQFVNLICEISKELSIDDMSKINWEYVKYMIDDKNYTELKQYLIERGIY